MKVSCMKIYRIMAFLYMCVSKILGHMEGYRKLNTCMQGYIFIPHSIEWKAFTSEATCVFDHAFVHVHVVLIW